MFLLLLIASAIVAAVVAFAAADVVAIVVAAVAAIAVAAVAASAVASATTVFDAVTLSTATNHHLYCLIFTALSIFPSQPRFSKDYSSDSKHKLNVLSVFGVLFNGVTGIMGRG